MDTVNLQQAFVYRERSPLPLLGSLIPKSCRWRQCSQDRGSLKDKNLHRTIDQDIEYAEKTQRWQSRLRQGLRFTRRSSVNARARNAWVSKGPGGRSPFDVVFALVLHRHLHHPAFLRRSQTVHRLRRAHPSSKARCAGRASQHLHLFHEFSDHHVVVRSGYVWLLL